MTVTKAELMEHLVLTQPGLSRAQARELLELFFSEIEGALERGEHVRLSGFGNFILRDKPTRPGRNPRTGVFHEISARRVVTFKTGVKLKQRLLEAKPKNYDAKGETKN